MLICMRALDFHQFDTRFHCVACRLRHSKAGKKFYICRTKPQPRRPLLHCSHAIIVITLALTEWHPIEVTCDWYFLPPHFHICIFQAGQTFKNCWENKMIYWMPSRRPIACYRKFQFNNTSRIIDRLRGIDGSVRKKSGRYSSAKLHVWNSDSQATSRAENRNVSCWIVIRPYYRT